MVQMGFLPRGSLCISSGGVDGDRSSSSEAGSRSAAVVAIEAQAIIRPAREVGGDFYDYFCIGADRLFFVLGDVSDKGIPAALFMAVTMTLLKGKKGLPLGVMDDMLYMDSEITLGLGDRIILYTDGITEAEDRLQSLMILLCSL